MGGSTLGFGGLGAIVRNNIGNKLKEDPNYLKNRIVSNNPIHAASSSSNVNLQQPNFDRINIGSISSKGISGLLRRAVLLKKARVI